MKRWLVSIRVMLFCAILLMFGSRRSTAPILERLVHGQVDLGISHHFVEVFADLGRRSMRARRSC